MEETLICDRLVQLIDPVKFRSGCLEYGASDDYSFENHLFEYENRNWKVLCLQPDENKFNNLRIYRRLSKLIDCEKGDGITLDGFIKRTNVQEIKILLIKNTKYPSRVLSGFDLSKYNTEIVCVQHPHYSEKRSVENILKNNGFEHFERVAVSDVYVKPGEMFSGELKEKSPNENLFEV